MGGNLRRFKQVLADGNRSVEPEFWTAKLGIKFLNPNRGGRERLVANLSNFFFRFSSKFSTTCQKFLITGFSE
jgi:hypothetical protein